MSFQKNEQPEWKEKRGTGEKSLSWIELKLFAINFFYRKREFNMTLDVKRMIILPIIPMILLYHIISHFI